MQDIKLGNRLLRVASLTVALCVMALGVSAQQAPAGGEAGGGGGQPGGGGARGGTPQPFVVHQLKPNVYWIEGGGGNSAVIVGNNGVIVVDAKTTAAGGSELLAAIARLTPKPVTTVLITHSDGDHTNGLAAFPKGLTIIAQENCRKEMEAAANAAPGGALADHMPTRIVTKNLEDLTIEGVHLRVYHFVPAHTSGDLMVALPDDRIMFTGDIITGQSPYPLIHLEKNGTSEGWITTVKGLVATDAATFVPGHGDVQTKADVQKRLVDMQSRRDQIKALAAQGKSLDEVRAGLGETPPAARGGGGGGGAPGGPGGAARGPFPSFQDFTAVIYAEQTKK